MGEDAMDCESIMDELGQPVYIADVDTYEMLYMNKACMRLLGCADYKGRTCYDVAQGASAPCEFCTNPKLKKGELYNWDHYNEKLGKSYQLQDKLMRYRGHNARMEIVFDVSDRVDRENKLETVLETERQLVRAIQTVSGAGTIDDRVNAALKICGEYFQADRAYVFHMEGDGRLYNTYEWCRDGIEPQIGFLQKIDIHYIDRWMPYFEKQAAVVTPDIEKIKAGKQDEYEIMSVQGIRSYMEAPLFSAGRFFGFLGVDNPAQEKMLNTDEILLSLAYSVSSALVRAKNEQELVNSNKRYELAEEAAELGVWEYHIKEHTITSPSHSFKKFGIPDVIENVPESILPLFPPEDRDRLCDMFARLGSGETRVTGDFWMKWRPDMQPRCEHTVYTVVKNERGEPDVAYGLGMNVTEQKREEEKFGHTIQSLLSANPESLCTFRVNLTKNLCQEGHGISEFVLSSLQSDTFDGLMRNVVALVKDGGERGALVREFDREKLLESFEAGVTGKHLDYRRMSETGEQIWVRSFIRMLKNPENDDVEGVIYSLNITNEKRRETAFRIIADQEYDFVALLYPNSGEFEFLNLSSRLLKKYHEALGVPNAKFDYEKIRKFAVSTYIAAEDRELYLEGSRLGVMLGNLDRNGRYEINVRGHYTGHPEEFMYRKIQHYYLDDSKDAVLVVQSDVTEALRSQQKEMQRVQDIVDSISAGISVLVMPDPDHLRFQYVNKQMYRLLGFEEFSNDIAADPTIKDSLIRSYLEDGFCGLHPDDEERVRKTFHDNYDEPFFIVDRYRTMGAGGEYHWLEEEVKLRETRPEGRMFYATYRDVGNVVRLQDELKEKLAEEVTLREQAMVANAAKSEFLSRMSHDMRTPLNGIMGMTYLTEEMDLPREARDNLHKIDTSSKFLLSLINDVLDMTKAESGKIELHPEPYSMEEFGEYLVSAFKPLYEAKGQTFNVEMRPVQDVVPMVDILRYNQIIFNLLSNAVKYTPEGGTISLSIKGELVPGHRERLTAVVSDNGVGMSSRFLKVLFEPFTQERRNDVSYDRGSGLGLAIVKKMVDLMGGAIAVESEPGKGTTFRVTADFDYIEGKQPEARPAKGGAEGGKAALAGRRVLLCEDHPLNQQITEALLHEKQVSVDMARDGREGLSMFESSVPGYYDAVLMDIRMPDMDGYEATEAIRALDRADAKTVPIIAMTADAFASDVRKCLAAGMNGHLAKPIDPEKMYAVLGEWMAKGKAGGAGE